jgi:general secretion pathway protein J
MPSKRISGFTLLELIISLSILAIVVVIIFGAMRIGVRAWEKGERDVEDQQRKRVVFDMLKHQISSACPTKKIVEENGESFIMRGNATSLEFLSYFPMLPANVGRLVQVTYRVIEDEENGSKYLALSEKEADVPGEGEQNAGTGPDQHFYPLFPDAQDIHFSYLSEGEEGKLQWTDDWNPNNGNAFPVAIRLSVTETKGSPPLVIIARLEQVAE